jgi:hypothetical protein
MIEKGAVLPMEMVVMVIMTMKQLYLLQELSKIIFIYLSKNSGSPQMRDQPSEDATLNREGCEYIEPGVPFADGPVYL